MSISQNRLCEITCKDKTWFAYTDAEKAEIVKKLEGKKLSINRSKGLGENDPEMMWMTTMNPATRRLIKVMPEDMERTMQIFDLLLGDNFCREEKNISPKTATNTSTSWTCREVHPKIRTVSVGTWLCST